MKIKKTVLSAALCFTSGLGVSEIANANAQATNVFEFIGSGALAPNRPFFAAIGSCTQPTGSWYSIMGGDITCGGSGGSSYQDYRSLRSINSTAIPGPNGLLDMNVVNTITPSSSGTNHNIGNMIDRDSAAGGSWAAHFTTSTLPVLAVDSMQAKVDMSGWRLTWNGSTVNLGTGQDVMYGTSFTGAYAFSNDGIWGNGNDTLEYFVSNNTSGISELIGFSVPCCTDVPASDYRLHLVGSFTPVVVPIPSAVWLMGSGLLGLMGVARRHGRRGKRDG
jgi:hypothetical protein